MTNESALVNFPRTVEALSAYDVLIISDCECEILSLYPFWIAGTEVPRTNRLKAIRQYTRKGGGLLIEALPVTCLKVLDDRIETPEGVRVNIKKPDHPVLKGIPWSECPVFEGFNKIIPKEGAEILATIGKCEDENPLILTWKFGKGRSMAFAGDCSPHWAAFFQPWQRYKTFWQQAIRWLGNKK